MSKPSSPKQQQPQRREPARARPGGAARRAPPDKAKDDPSLAPESGEKPQSYPDDDERFSQAP